MADRRWRFGIHDIKNVIRTDIINVRIRRMIANRRKKAGLERDPLAKENWIEASKEMVHTAAPKR